MNDEQIKNFIMYGEAGKDDSNEHLDWAVTFMLNSLQGSVFDRKTIESLLWKRITELYNKGLNTPNK